ncbi:hypothetical protein C8F04DRAFT_929739, partial [Mycena alexandri]
PHWDRILPTYRTNSPNTLIYVNKSIPSSTYKQNKIKSPYVTSITLTIDNRSIDIFSLYNPPETGDPSDNAPIRATISSLGPPSPSRSLLLLGDFNRHHPLWSGI